MIAKFKSLFVDVDWYILAAAIVLMVVGVLFIYSSGVTSTGVVVSTEYVRQIVWVVLGTIFMFLFILVDYKRIKDSSFLIYVAMMVLLVYTRFFGRVVNGSRSWIGIGDLGIQPSEFAKIATILFLAKYLESSQHAISAFRRFLGSLVIVGIPMLLVLSQPDFGTALVFIPIFLAMTYLCGLEKRYIVFLLSTVALTLILSVLPLWEHNIAVKPTGFLFVLYEGPYIYWILAALAIVFGLSVWGFLAFRKKYYFWIAYVSLIFLSSITIATLGHKVLKDYQIMRLIVFLDPTVDPRGSGWNILQSITAIGSGGITGRGFLQGTQSHYRFLPQQSTDFIFSILSEEWGFWGGLLVFGMYGLILWRSLALLKMIKDPYAVGIIAGISGMILFHFMINVGMTMGIMPITGIPLFFLSYGGSSLWTVLIGIGLVLGISARRYHS
jgi:rod shape determining protein RodA